MSIKIKKLLDRRQIKRELLDYFRLNLSVEKIKLWDKYLNKIGIEIPLWNVLLNIVDNLKIVKQGNSYLVEVNKNIQLGKYNLDELARLIDQGNLEIKGTNLFTDGFEYLKYVVR